MTRTVRSLVVGLLALGTFLVPGAAAYALWSNTATATLTGVTTVAVPAAPTLSCAGNNNKVDFSWTAVSGTGITYSLYYKTTINGTYASFATGLTTTSKTGVQKSDFAGMPSTVFVVVRAVTSGGVESANSNMKTVLFDQDQCA